MLLVVCGMTSVATANVVFVLDGHTYSSPADIIYRTNNQKVLNPNVINCLSGGIPVPNLEVGTTFKTGDNIHIGLSAIHYNLNQSRFYLTSVLGNVICNGGVYDDGLFIGGFE
ncbi:MAG: hypothetical protein DWP95_11090 [Proteobacteria bacterium]|nr:MAG: hypothetical protein DWP95_11090 [Pseudomonadota bacterium]